MTSNRHPAGTWDDHGLSGVGSAADELMSIVWIDGAGAQQVKRYDFPDDPKPWPTSDSPDSLWGLGTGVLFVNYSKELPADKVAGYSTSGTLQWDSEPVELYSNSGDMVTFEVVPEPITLSLVALGGLAMLKPKRKG